MVGGFVLALITGGILALLSYPIHKKLMARGIWPKVSASLVIVGLIIVVISPLAFFADQAIKQGIVIEKELANNQAFSLNAMIELANSWMPKEISQFQPNLIDSKIQEWMQSLTKIVTVGLVGVAANLPDFLLKLALVLISCFFFLLDGANLNKWAADKVPLDIDVRLKIVRSFNDTAIATIWATLAAGAVQSLILFVGYLALGVPGAFLAAGATFIFAWIPLVGTTPVWAVGAFYLYVNGFVTKGTIMLVIGLVASLSDNAVRPMILKGRSNMHPLVSLVAIFGGISIFGILGVFLGPIVVAVWISLLNIWPAIAQRFDLVSQKKT